MSSRERVFEGGRLLVRLRVLLPETMIFKDVDVESSSSKGTTPKEEEEEEEEEEEIEGAPVAAIAEANAEVKAGGKALIKASIKAAENAEAKELSMRSGREVKSSVCDGRFQVVLERERSKEKKEVLDSLNGNLELIFLVKSFWQIEEKGFLSLLVEERREREYVWCIDLQCRYEEIDHSIPPRETK